MAKDLDTGGSIDLRVPGRAKGAPWLGMHQDWEWGQFSTEKLPGIPWALLAPVKPGTGGPQSPPALGQGHSHAWGDSGVGRSPVCHNHAKGFVEEIPGELNAQAAAGIWESSPAPPEWLCRVGTRGPSLGGNGAWAGDRQS